MRIQLDEKADALYVRLDESTVKDSQEVRPGVILDFNEKDQVVGIEIVGVKDRISIEDLKKLKFEVA